MTEAHSILIVEDDREFQTTLLDFFRSQSPDYRVSAVPSLPETLPALQENTPDVVLLDLKLGKDSGLDILKLLRNNDRFRNTRVIVVTGDSDLERRRQTLAMGADDFLSKPLALRDLEEVLDKIKMNRYSTRENGPLEDRASRKKRQAHREVLVFSKSGSEGAAVSDFIDVRFQKNRLLMILAEVSGNGGDTARAATLLRSLSDRFLPLLVESRSDLYLNALHEHLAAESLGSQIPSITAAVLDLGSRSLHFSGSNAPAPVFLPLGQKEWRQMLPQDAMGEKTKPAQTTVPVQEGDRVFLYSGGPSDLLDAQTFPERIGAAEPHFSDLKNLLESKSRPRTAERKPGFILFQIVPHFSEGKRIHSISEALPLLRRMEDESRFRGYDAFEFQAFLFSLERILRDVFGMEREAVTSGVLLEIEINCKYIFFSIRPTGFWARLFPSRARRFNALARVAREIEGKLQELKLSDDGRLVSGIRYRNPFD